MENLPAGGKHTMMATRMYKSQWPALGCCKFLGDSAKLLEHVCPAVGWLGATTSS